MLLVASFCLFYSITEEQTISNITEFSVQLESFPVFRSLVKTCHLTADDTLKNFQHIANFAFQQCVSPQTRMQKSFMSIVSCRKIESCQLHWLVKCSIFGEFRERIAVCFSSGTPEFSFQFPFQAVYHCLKQQAQEFNTFLWSLRASTDVAYNHIHIHVHKNKNKILLLLLRRAWR